MLDALGMRILMKMMMMMKRRMMMTTTMMMMMMTMMIMIMRRRKKKWELLEALGRRRELILSVLKAAIHPHAPSLCTVLYTIQIQI